MALSKPVDGTGQLDDTEIHTVLSNERRQMILDILSNANGSVSARELSERIAELETGESPPPKNIRHSAYISLIQTHLPKLDELDVVDFDNRSKEVRLGGSAKEVSSVMGVKMDPSPGKYYLVISVTGLIVILSAKAGLPVSVATSISGLLLLGMMGLAFFRSQRVISAIRKVL